MFWTIVLYIVLVIIASVFVVFAIGLYWYLKMGFVAAAVLEMMLPPRWYPYEEIETQAEGLGLSAAQALYILYESEYIEIRMLGPDGMEYVFRREDEYELDKDGFVFFLPMMDFRVIRVPPPRRKKAKTRPKLAWTPALAPA